MDKCPYCSAETRPGDNFCLNCGNRLLPSTPLPQVENTALLILRTDNGQVLQEYILEKPEISIGRAPNSDILLSRDKLASRLHATIRYENGNYLLRDERSANGTFVNGQQIEQMTPRTLQDNDHIGIGEHELIFRAAKSRQSGLDKENMQTIAVGSSSLSDVTYLNREDEFLIGATSDDFSTRAMSGGADSSELAEPASAPEAVPAQPVATWAPSEAPGTPVVATPPLGEDAGSQDTTKVLSLFAIARTALEENDRAFIRKVYSVEAGISQTKPEGFEGEPFKLPLRSSIRFLFLEILLQSSSNIALISHWHRRLRYDSHNPEPQLVAFKFKVVAVGSCSLVIDYYYERRWLKTIKFAFDAVEQPRLTAIASEG
jgi:pSer/pThr/pTyr-binding forkhead associated (FHA) protein